MMKGHGQKVRFDDRLKTVLALRPRDAHDRAVRWRQLVELLARAGGSQTPLVRQALDEARSELGAIDEQLRAATARAIARAQLPAELVALFAADTIAVAAPVLAAARLSPDEWATIVGQASGDSLRFLRSLHPELVPEPAEPEPAAPVPAEPELDGGAAVEQQAEAVESPVSEPAVPPSAPVPSISEVVARIEKLRRERERLSDRRARPQRAAGGSAQGAALFRWECGPSGEIDWVEGVPRGPLIGRSLASPGEYNGVDDKIKRAFAVRAPFRQASLSISGEGVAAGEWKLSGVPAFEPSDGRFSGYRGVAVRGEPSETPVEARAAVGFDSDSIRELVHELKTPLNAIIGFAEIIDGQYLGPADYSYRERAADIVAQARLLLSAIEDLDLAAQLRSTPEQASGSTDLRDLLATASTDLADRAGRRGAALLLELPPKSVNCAVEHGLAERIVRRFCTSLIDVAAKGERMRLTLSGDEKNALLSLEKPRALREAEERTGIADTADGAEPKEILGTGVSLRLVRALARVAGGDLIDAADRAVLVLPRGS